MADGINSALKVQVLCDMYLIRHKQDLTVEVYVYIYNQGVPGGMCQTSGEYSLSLSIPI